MSLDIASRSYCQGVSKLERFGTPQHSNTAKGLLRFNTLLCLFIAFVVRVAPKPLYLSFDYLSQLSVSGLSFYAGVSTGCMK